MPPVVFRNQCWCFSANRMRSGLAGGNTTPKRWFIHKGFTTKALQACETKEEKS
jgi:hypothetical protein